MAYISSCSVQIILNGLSSVHSWNKEKFRMAFCLRVEISSEKGHFDFQLVSSSFSSSFYFRWFGVAFILSVLKCHSTMHFYRTTV